MSKREGLFAVLGVLGSVRLVYKPLVLICTADLLEEKNIVPWLLIMAAEQRLDCI